VQLHRLKHVLHVDRKFRETLRDHRIFDTIVNVELYWITVFMPLIGHSFGHLMSLLNQGSGVFQPWNVSAFHLVGFRLTYGLACVTSKNTVNRHIPGSSGNDVSSFWWWRWRETIHFEGTQLGNRQACTINLSRYGMNTKPNILSKSHFAGQLLLTSHRCLYCLYNL